MTIPEREFRERFQTLDLVRQDALLDELTALTALETHRQEIYEF